VHRQALYSELARYYDKIYWSKDYQQEVAFVLKALERNGVKGRRVLDVATGTGGHARILAAKGFEVTGVDISEDVLRIAQSKVKGNSKFVKGDMRNLGAVGLDGGFDAATCLFSSISYNLNVGELKLTLRGIYDQLREGGVVVFDTHFTKEDFMDGYRGEDIFDDGRVFGARLSISKRDGDVGQVSFSYLIKDGGKTLVLRNDVHKFGLFDPEDFLKTMGEVGFVDANAFLDWKFEKTRSNRKFRDVVFAGRKPGREE